VAIAHELTEARGGEGVEFSAAVETTERGKERRVRTRGEVLARSSHLCTRSRRGGTSRARTPRGSAALSSVATTAPAV
jgi:hypothetical protein